MLEIQTGELESIISSFFLNEMQKSNAERHLAIVAKDLLLVNSYKDYRSVSYNNDLILSLLVQFVQQNDLNYTTPFVFLVGNPSILGYLYTYIQNITD